MFIQIVNSEGLLDSIIEIFEFKAVIQRYIPSINIYSLLCAKHTGFKHWPQEAYILDSSGGDT